MNNGEITDYTEVFGARKAVASTAGVFQAVYGWMCAGLLLSGLVAWFTAASGLWQKVLAGPGFIGCIVAELALVWILSASIRKLSVPVAILMFIGYALLNGLTLSVVFIAYKLPLVGRTFLLTAGMFGGLAVYGTSGLLALLLLPQKSAAIWDLVFFGLILVCVVNIFFPTQRFDWLISLAGIVIFTGLTMWDAQKIKLMASDEALMSQPGAKARLAIIGALELYLDFINLFLMLLRFFGGRSRD